MQISGSKHRKERFPSYERFPTFSPATNMGAANSWLSKFLDYVRLSWNQNTTYTAQHSFVVLDTTETHLKYSGTKETELVSTKIVTGRSPKSVAFYVWKWKFQGWSYPDPHSSLCWVTKGMIRDGTSILAYEKLIIPFGDYNFSTLHVDHGFKLIHSSCLPLFKCRSFLHVHFCLCWCFLISPCPLSSQPATWVPPDKCQLPLNLLKIKKMSNMSIRYLHSVYDHQRPSSSWYSNMQ